MTTPVVHDLQLSQDFYENTWTAFCSCGWQSAERGAEIYAIDEWEDHCDLVFIEATAQP